MKVAIAYGFAEGKWHAKAFRALLAKNGFTNTRLLGEADIIIAHSGGCFMLPKNNQAKLVLLIGLPYWPGRHPKTNLRHKVKLEPKNAYWLKKSLLSAFYLLAKPAHWSAMNQAFKLNGHPKLSPKQQVIVVRNKQDVFSLAADLRELAKANAWDYKELEGHHDDLWERPELYIKLIKEAI